MLHALMEGNLNSYVIDNSGMSDLLSNGRKETESMFFETRLGMSEDAQSPPGRPSRSMRRWRSSSP